MEKETLMKSLSLYDKIVEHSKLQGFHQSCDPKTGYLLKGLASSKAKGKFLELGTGSGASAAWIVDGMDGDSTLITVDINPQLLDIAKTYLGNDKRISFRCEDGAIFIRNMEETFDFIFADTWPGKFELLDKTLDHLNVGGFYVIHDLLPDRSVPEEYRIKAPKLLNKLRERRDLVITEVDWATGILLAIKTME
ncbi:O-methyltransferase [Ectobacillus polymachus]|uniref:O-methyltransferase n=1 Tax=Ectobacillus polymachus TaxID=1508806 RepID=UPI003A87D1D8